MEAEMNATKNRSRSVTLIGVWTLLLTLFGAAGLLPLHAAADVNEKYEFEGEWAPGTPEDVQTGEIVSSIWWFNLNDQPKDDHQNLPSNDPLDNVTVTLNSFNGVFSEIPNICLTEGVDPESSITHSEDGLDSTLVCNVGTQDLGTALKIVSSIEVTGEDGSQVWVEGEYDEYKIELPPLKIINDLVMDIALLENGDKTELDGSQRKVAYNWTLFHGKHSPEGPEEVTYSLTVESEVGRDDKFPASNSALECSAFAEGSAVGHPWSGGSHSDDQLTRFPTCEITGRDKVADGKYKYTLKISGLDYSKDDVPTKDSKGDRLPSDRDAIAAGELWFSIDSDEAVGRAELDLEQVTYTAKDGERTAEDNVENNHSEVSWTTGVPTGGWIGPGTWDDTIRLSPGQSRESTTGLNYANSEKTGRDSQLCTILDVDHVVFDKVRLIDLNYANADLAAKSGVTVEFFTGDPKPQNPQGTSPSPVSDICAGNKQSSSWTTTKPVDADIAGVRAKIPASAMKNDSRPTLRVNQVIKDDVSHGQDVWVWHDYSLNEFDDWAGQKTSLNPVTRSHSWDAQDRPTVGTSTPDARYPFTGPARDVLRVVSAEPHISKSASDAVIMPGDTVTYDAEFTLSSPRKGASTYETELTDVLPKGASYVPESASITPAISGATTEPDVSGTTDGGQTLVWMLPEGVDFNEDYVLTYDVVFDGDPNVLLPAGKQLKNTITMRIGEFEDGDFNGLEDSDNATVAISETGLTKIVKSVKHSLIPRKGADAERNEWTVRILSEDPSVSAFTDVIDVLPFDGDGRGSSHSGSYVIEPVEVPAGAKVFYTTEDPESISDDPADASNGGVNNPSAMWSQDFDPDATAIRVIGPQLAPGGIFEFTIPFEVDGFKVGDTLGNRAQGVAENTRLVMRTSAETTTAPSVSAELKKYVLANDGQTWLDANDLDEAPSYLVGDEVSYKIVVTNTGEDVLRDFVVEDDVFPEGNHAIDVLQPGDSHEFEFTVTLEADDETVIGGEVEDECNPSGWDESMTDTVVNHAQATAVDSDGDELVIPCDPAIIKNPGEPTHEKSLVSATPAGDGLWDVVYDVTVENQDDRDTSYTLSDELRFTQEVDVVDAHVVDSPEGVTLFDPAWDGADNTIIAAEVFLAANDDTDYAPHVYTIKVVADAPSFIDTDGDVDPTECASEEAGPADTAFTNTSQLTKPNGDTEDDWACAPIPSLAITKDIVDGPTKATDGTWDITYHVVVENNGSEEADYDLFDQLRFGEALTVEGTQTAGPDGVDLNPEWTGLGQGEQAEENLLAKGVVLPAGESHTYIVTVNSSIDTDDAPASSLECPPPASADTGGFANTATLTHNDLVDLDEDCAPGEEDIPPLPSTGVSSHLPALAVGATLLLLGGVGLILRRYGPAAH